MALLDLGTMRSGVGKDRATDSHLNRQRECSHWWHSVAIDGSIDCNRRTSTIALQGTLVMPLGNLRVMLRARLPGTGVLYVMDEHPNRGSLDPN